MQNNHSILFIGGACFKPKSCRVNIKIIEIARNVQNLSAGLNQLEFDSLKGER